MMLLLEWNFQNYSVRIMFLLTEYTLWNSQIMHCGVFFKMPYCYVP